jgi:hypothetical protein
MNGYAVHTTALFDRLLVRLNRHHSDLPRALDEAIAILEADPYNITRRHLIRKLRGVKPGKASTAFAWAAGGFVTICGTSITKSS